MAKFLTTKSQRTPFSPGGDSMENQCSPSIHVPSLYLICKTTSSSTPLSLSLSFQTLYCFFSNLNLQFPILSRDSEFQKICLIIVSFAKSFSSTWLTCNSRKFQTGPNCQRWNLHFPFPFFFFAKRKKIYENLLRESDRMEKDNLFIRF